MIALESTAEESIIVDATGLKQEPRSDGNGRHQWTSVRFGMAQELRLAFSAVSSYSRAVANPVL